MILTVTSTTTAAVSNTFEIRNFNNVVDKIIENGVVFNTTFVTETGLI